MIVRIVGVLLVVAGVIVRIVGVVLVVAVVGDR